MLAKNKLCQIQFQTLEHGKICYNNRKGGAHAQDFISRR